MIRTPLLLSTLAAVCLPLPTARAENWNAWRGPRGDGTSLERAVPLRWSATENIAWKVPVPGAGHASPIVWDNRVFLVTSDNGIASCFVAHTGDRVWRTRLGRHSSASPVTAAGLVYFLDDDGTTKVVRPGGEFELLAENRLDEPCSASPAISHGSVFIRTDEHLYRIGPEQVP